MKFLSKFKKDEDGAVTVDWVVLTAGVVILAGIAMNAVKGALTNITSTVSNAIENPLSQGSQ
jgi:Flp pilus assembly pilin Flp